MGDFKPGWYIFLFMSGSGPALTDKQPEFDVVYLTVPLVNGFLENSVLQPKIQGRGGRGRPSTNPLLVQFGNMLHHDYPDVYSIGPYESSQTAQEIFDQQLAGLFKPRRSGPKRRYNRAYRVIDVTAGIIFNNANQAAAATGGDPTAIRRVCKGERKTHLGQRWAFEDPGAPGVPISPEVGDRKNR